MNIKFFKSYKWNSLNLFLVIILKLYILSVFSSEYSISLFMPFVKSFELGNNPWQYYYENNLNLNSFPYHALMLYIFSPIMWLMNYININSPIISNLLFKVPLFISDIVLLIVFTKLFPHKEKRIFYFYFLNPIVVYATYIHSQLDIIAMMFLMTGIYFITIERLKLSALLVGFALSTKFHILICVPLLLFYNIKNYGGKQAALFLFIVFVVVFILDYPYLFSDGFINMVLINPKQSLLFDSYYEIGSLKLLLPVTAIFMIYFHFFNQNKINQDLLYFYFGILFTATIFFIYPAPAWYIWIVPFISIYFIKNENKKKILFFHVFFSITYLIFFVVFYKSEYNDILYFNKEIDLKIKNENFTNISFTFLEVTLLAIMYAFYKYGIKSNSVYKKHLNLTIGIGGDSGVGKTSLLNNLSLLLGSKLLKIEGDGEHKWERGDENWKAFTHLDPKANYIHKQANAIHDLKVNNFIYRSEYDHKTGKFLEPIKVKPKEYIAISGLHPFYLPKLRKNIDLKIYLDTSEDLRRHWKIVRDTKKRGYSIKEILKQIDERSDDAIKYIYPQKNFADLVIRLFPINNLEIGVEDQEVNLGLKIMIDANIYFEDILEKLECSYNWDYNKDLTTQVIVLNNEPKNNFKFLASQYIANINEIVIFDCKWLEGYSGFIQFISLMMISEKLKEVN